MTFARQIVSPPSLGLSVHILAMTDPNDQHDLPRVL
jgi:hypothetical protein